MSIEPNPTKLTWTSDAEGNFVAHAWFESLSDELRITNGFEVETLRSNTFDQ